MWKAVVLISFASVALLEARAQNGVAAESLPFHGFLPEHNVRASPPKGDGQPNDIYMHLEQPPVLAQDEVVLYPRNLVGLGLEYGQDPEQHVYQIRKSGDVAKSGKKHDKHGKNSHNDQHSHSKDSKGKNFNMAPTADTHAPRPSPHHPQPNFHPSSAPYNYNNPNQGSFPNRPPSGSHPHPSRKHSPRAPSFPPRLPHQY
ncbi:hypothetical protein Pmani_000302 [Petrolisthes manimaculis]|uniref:Uncharacterized protein n=1 Tax=Petrolisthes manimaculis TaxID=1843537 RepID=A0AAE1QN66_9EUCA|nr:hypothetical protein Pmani_000302 [Petrolisthes manimaculis]